MIHRYEKNDAKETFTVKKVETSTPPKSTLPSTGEKTGAVALAGVALVIFAVIATQIDKIKALLPKGKKD